MPATLPGHRLFALLVAGGSGTRLGAPMPKQFLLVGNKPILVHTLETFLAYNPALRVVLVLPEAHFPTWQQLAQEYLSPEQQQRITLAPGGASRTDSVRNGLTALQQLPGTPPDALVAIQDAVRPFTNPQMIAEAYEAAATKGSGVCAVPSKSSMRMRTPEGSVAVDREAYFAVQTPQTFALAPLLEAYFHRTPEGAFTDDASLLEAAGYPIHLVMGSYDNIKITTPEDMALAALLLPDFLAKWRRV